MELVKKTAPFVRKPTARVNRFMGDVSIALSPLVIFAVVQHGLSAVWILLAAVLSMVLTEYVYYQIIDILNGESFKLINKSFTLSNFSVLTSGVIYGLTLSDVIPLPVVIIGGVIGVFLAKMIFGGLGQNIFNIAAFARVFVALSYGGALVYEAFVDAEAGATVLGMLSVDLFDASVTEYYSYWSMFSGIGFPGSLGETSTLLILVGGLYLFLRKSFDIFVPITVIATVAFLSFAVVLTQEDAGLWFVATQVLSGGIMFAAVYMATDPITMPITRPGRIYFAFGVGALTFFIRVFAQLPEGVVFSLVLMNMFVPAIDYPRWTTNKFTVRNVAIFAAVVLLTAAIAAAGVNYAI